MLFSFNDFGTQQSCQIVITLGNTVIQNTSMPLVFAQNEFMNIFQQIAKDDRPMKIECIKKIETELGKEIENSLIFMNNVYIKNFENEVKI